MNIQGILTTGAPAAHAMPNDLVVVRGLLRSLDAIDSYRLPKGREGRSAADRDEARALSAIIRAIVPDLEELAAICVDYWAEQLPDILRQEGRTYYLGPDVFRGRESSNCYPDDSGQNDDDSEWRTWAQLNGLGDREDVFEDKVYLRLTDQRERFRMSKKRAAALKRATTRRRTEVFQQMLRTASMQN